MKENFSLKHKGYLNYLQDNTKSISRSKMWSDLSPDFLTEISGDKPLFGTFRQKKYFVQFGRDKKESIMEKFRYKIAKVLKDKINKINRRIVDKDLQWRMIFKELGYYNVKTKYTLQDHPLFGRDKCMHRVVLCLQWHNYCVLYPYIKNIGNMKYLEIGAGSGLLSMFLHHDLGAKVAIVDLPEMISYSSVCINKMFPRAKVLFPNEVKGNINFDDYDYVFLLPDQTDYLPESYFDLAVNCQSMGEMRREEIELYFKVIQEAVKNGGYFFCSNRLRKQPDSVSTTDTILPLTDEVPGTNQFFQYPWNNNNIDVFIDVHHYRFNWMKESPLTIDRIQQIVK